MSGFLARLRRFDSHPRVVALVRACRLRLPGDSRYGDLLSLARSEAPHLLGRRLAAVTAERPSALREAGLSALQVWQGLSEVQGRGHGDRELAIVFTDLVDFSTWALEAGDAPALAPSTSPRASPRRPAPTRCSCQRQCATASKATG